MNTTESIKQVKDKIRKQMREKKRHLDAKFAKEANFAVCRNLKIFVSDNVNKICAFYPSFGEPDIIPVLEELISNSKKVYLPSWIGKEGYRMRCAANFADALSPGRFSIPEPVSGDFLNKSAPPDLWLVPGIAFSSDGVRLGYGEGTYDKLLNGSDVLKIGICYEFQLLKELPSEEHDVKMNYIVTEKNIYKCKTEKKEIVYE